MKIGPYETGRVYQGDCLELMKAIPDGAMDAVVTDIPYSQTTHSGARGAHAREGLIAYDSISGEEAVFYAQAFLRVARRWVVFFCDWRHLLGLESLPEFVRAGVWVKNDPAPQFSGDRPATGWESIAILHRKGKKRWNGGGKPAVWRSNIVKRSPLRGAQKPIVLMSDLLKLFSDRGVVVLDPFAGSGTTGAACVELGREFLGFEVDPGYCKLANERISAARKGITLAEERAGQGTLFDTTTEK